MNRGWTYRDIQLMPFVDYYSLILWKIIAICIYGYVSALTGDFYLVKGTLGLMRLFPHSASCWNDLRRVIPRGHMAWLEPMYWLEHMAWLEPMCWLENLTAYVTGTIPAFDMDLSKENSHRNVISEGRRPLLAKTSMLKEGIYIINLRKPWEKLQMTTRVIVAIENPHDIIVQSARPYGQRDVLKFAQYTGADAIAGRHARGTFTNKMQTSFSEPRLLILTNPRTDHQPIKEYALGNISCIAFCDTDSPMHCVDISIPANNKGKQSIGCLYWLLARMVLQMRATILPGRKWENMVDLFFYRDPEEAKDLEEEEALVAPEYGAVAEYAAPTGDTWGAEWPGAVPPLLLLKDKLGLARLLQLLWLIGCGCSPCPYSHLTRQCAITYSELGVKE